MAEINDVAWHVPGWLIPAAEVVAYSDARPRQGGILLHTGPYHDDFFMVLDKAEQDRIEAFLLAQGLPLPVNPELGYRWKVVETDQPGPRWTSASATFHATEEVARTAYQASTAAKVALCCWDDASRWFRLVAQRPSTPAGV